jgi:hypothetical protein
VQPSAGKKRAAAAAGTPRSKSKRDVAFDDGDDE